MDPTILTLEQFNQVRPFVAMTEDTTSPIKAKQISKDGSKAPSTTEELEEVEAGLQRRKSKQPLNIPVGGVALEVALLQQISPEKSKFLHTLSLLLFLAFSFCNFLPFSFWFCRSEPY